MKRRNSFDFILIFLLVFLFSACSQNSGGETKKAVERTVKNDIFLEGENVGGLKETEALQKIKAHALKNNLMAMDAMLDADTWKIKEAEKTGGKVNVEKTLESLINSTDGSRAKLIIEKVTPEITSQKLKSNIVEIGSCTTPLLDKAPKRINNIEVAASMLNYEKVAPKSMFSFNSVLGRRTKGKGYDSAPIIVKGKQGPEKGSGVGGGICQLSSTLYNAAAEGGLEIIERHSHSDDVGYLERGNDATVSYGAKDLKFKNNRDFPIMIRIFLEKDTLSVKIFENRN